LDELFFFNFFNREEHKGFTQSAQSLFYFKLMIVISLHLHIHTSAN